MKIIYGIGNIGKEYVDTLIRKKIKNFMLVDSQEKLWGEKYRDFEIHNPQIILNVTVDQVIVSTSWDKYLEIKDLLIRKYKLNDEQVEWFGNVLYITDSAEKMEENFLKDVLYFCTEAQMLHNGENCAKYYKYKYNSTDCDNAINYLFTIRKMGAYIYGKDQDPQQHMRKYILNNIHNISKDSFILEVGPGNLPLFSEDDYPNWYGVDYNYEHGIINFGGNTWGGFYHKLFAGSWDNLGHAVSENIGELKFDLVCGSHSFEHCNTPITALKEAAKVLKKDGYLVIFVPDGYSTWPGNYDKTHSIYPNVSMLQDFFEFSGSFELICCEQFRTNMDLVAIARKL